MNKIHFESMFFGGTILITLRALNGGEKNTGISLNGEEEYVKTKQQQKRDKSVRRLLRQEEKEYVI